MRLIVSGAAYRSGSGENGLRTDGKRDMNRHRWSSRVTKESDALTLEGGVFSKRSPRAIARSLKASAEHSTRRKSSPFRSAMSMLNFYINRGGSRLDSRRKMVLERAKDELRRLFGKRKQS